jgi:hypothetical protein
MNRLWLLWLMAGLALPVALERARGQARLPGQPPDDPRSDSHVPIVPGAVGDPDQAQFLLEQRLHRAKDLAGLEKLLQDPELRKLAEDVARDPKKFGMTREEIEKLARQMGAGKGPVKPDLNDPRWRELLDRAIKQQSEGERPGTGIQPELRERWKELRDKLLPPKDEGREDVAARPDQGPGTEPEKQPGKMTPPVPPPPLPAGPPPGHPPPAPGPGTPFPPASMPMKPADLSAQEKFSKELVDFAEHLSGKNGLLQKSPALRDALRDLSRSLESEGGHSLVKDQTKELGDRLPGLGKYLGLDRPDWGKGLLAKGPHVNLDKSDFAVSVPAGWQSSPVGAPGAPGIAGLQMLLWVAVLAVFGVAVWRLLAWRRARVAAAGGWRLGPWPVHPAAVRTRGDLVRAFEHLSLLLLGPTARAWNHLEIAARICADAGGDGRAARGTAAARLAFLYEQARYAPPAEVLPDADLAAARRHLCLLAGVPAA